MISIKTIRSFRLLMDLLVSQLCEFLENRVVTSDLITFRPENNFSTSGGKENNEIHEGSKNNKRFICDLLENKFQEMIHV